MFTALCATAWLWRFFLFSFFFQSKRQNFYLKFQDPSLVARTEQSLPLEDRIHSDWSQLIWILQHFLKSCLSIGAPLLLLGGFVALTCVAWKSQEWRDIYCYSSISRGFPGNTVWFKEYLGLRWEHTWISISREVMQFNHNKLPAHSKVCSGDPILHEFQNKKPGSQIGHIWKQLWT